MRSEGKREEGGERRRRMRERDSLRTGGARGVGFIFLFVCE